MKISVSMIVKNEEAMLAKCLQSVSFADEIIVVDTGSTDKTKEIAKQFTDKIYDFEWCDDFAKARNFALSKCTGDWVLSIDADEIFLPLGKDKIRSIIETTKEDRIGILMVSEVTSYHVPRLFRRIPSNVWVGRIHETMPAGHEKSDISIYFGSSPAHKLDPERNIRMLKKAVEDEPENARALYYLGREHGYRKEWAEMKLALTKCIKYTKWEPEEADALFMLSLAFWYDGKGHGEWARFYCREAIGMNPNFKAAILLMAHMSHEIHKKPWLAMAEAADNSNTLFARKNHLIV